MSYLDKPTIEDSDSNLYYLDKYSDNVTKVNDCAIRNVLLLGATASGKSTFKNVLINPKTIAGKWSPYSQTRDAILSSFIFEKSNTKYNMNLIDTPGLYENKSGNDNFKARANEEIQRVIIDCIENEITKINVVFFLLSYVNKVGTNDIDAVKYFLEVFPILRDKSYLILTNCEDADRDDLNDWIKEMGSNDTFKYFLDNKKILTTGCIDRANYLKKRRSVISDIYQNIVGLREKILDIIINCEKQYQIDVIRQGKALKESMDMELKKFKQIKENIKEKNEFR